MSQCQQELRRQGKPYPRTCPTCLLGPCQRAPSDNGSAVSVSLNRDEKLKKLAYEYRPTMDKEILHSWAADVVKAIEGAA